jgi:predicted AAA+ superfamily ATPase
MRPMTLAEAGYSSGRVSLAAVLAGERAAAPDPGLAVGDLAERIVTGGWPGNLGLTPAQAMRANAGYLEDTCRVDVSRVDGTRRDPAGVRALLGSLARNVACPVTVEVLAADAGADRVMKTETVRAYLAALERLMITDDVPAWKPGLRSRTRLRGAAIRHLADPSLAAAALNAGADALLADLHLMGLLFESLVVRDLRVYADAVGGRLFHYRDALGLEADAVVELPGGGWAAFEVKLGSSPAVVDRAAANLVRLRDRVAGRPPVALAVITATGWALTRPDGVLQIPVGAVAA